MTSTSFITGAGLKKCTPTILLGAAGADRDVGDRQRRGVGGEDGVVPAHPVQLGEDRALQVEPLGHCLDDEVAVAQVGEFGGQRDPAEDLALRVLGEPAAFHRPPGGGLQVPAAALQRVLVHLDADDAEAAAREHLGDARAHGAQSDDPDSAERTTTHGVQSRRMLAGRRWRVRRWRAHRNLPARHSFPPPCRDLPPSGRRVRPGLRRRRRAHPDRRGRGRRRAGGVRRGLAGRAPLHAVRGLPVGDAHGRACCWPHLPDPRGHGGERAVHPHPVALGEQAAMLHLLSGGRFTWAWAAAARGVDLEVFGAGLARYEPASPSRWTCCSLAALPTGSAGRASASASARCPWCRARTGRLPPGDGRVHVARHGGSPRERGLPMLLGMHVGDEEKAAAVARHGLPDAPHVSAGVAQVADTRAEAVKTLMEAMPGWLGPGLDGYVAGRRPSPPDARPVRLHRAAVRAAPGGPAGRLCARPLAATAERTGIRRFALLVEGSGYPRRDAGEHRPAGRARSCRCLAAVRAEAGRDAGRRPGVHGGGVPSRGRRAARLGGVRVAAPVAGRRGQQSREFGGLVEQLAAGGDEGRGRRRTPPAAGRRRPGGSSGRPAAPRSGAAARRVSRHSPARAAAGRGPARPAAASGCRRSRRRPPSAGPPAS